MKSSDKTSSQDVKSKKKPREKKGHPFLLGMICLGVILFALAGYLRLTGGGIRPPDLSGTLHDAPIDTGLIEDRHPEATVTPATSKLPVDVSGRKEGVYTFILAGTDLDDYNSDTLMVASLDTKNGKLNVLNIPRDTQVAVKRSTKKINAAWGIGSIDQLKAELKTVIGFEPDAYAVVGLEGFVKLINAIGGVDFDVPRNMKYNDPDQNLRINLEKGPQHLDGDQAIQLVRFRRYQEGDIKRVELQQQFLTAVFQQTVSLKNLFKLAEFVRIAQDHLRTNLDLGQMTWLGQQIMKLDADSITFYTLPGDPYANYKGLSYFLVDQEQTLALINEVINPFTKPITADNIHLSHLRDN